MLSSQGREASRLERLQPWWISNIAPDVISAELCKVVFWKDQRCWREPSWDTRGVGPTGRRLKVTVAGRSGHRLTPTRGRGDSRGRPDSPLHTGNVKGWGRRALMNCLFPLGLTWMPTGFFLKSKNEFVGITNSYRMRIYQGVMFPTETSERRCTFNL